MLKNDPPPGTRVRFVRDVGKAKGYLPNPCLSLERATGPDQQPDQNQRFTNSSNSLEPIQLSLDLTPDHDLNT